MKKNKITVLGLGLLLTMTVASTSCSSDNDTAAQTETKSTTSSGEDALIGMWKQEGIGFQSYIQFNNGLWAGGIDLSDPFSVSKYFIEDGNIMLESILGGYIAMPYSFKDGKLIINQYGMEEVYSYYGEPLDITNDFRNFKMLYISKWTTSVDQENHIYLTLKFLENGELKYSYDQNLSPTPSSKLDKTGTYRIEKDQIYIDWNDGNGETVQRIMLEGGSLAFKYPEGSGKADIGFYQS